MKRIILFFSALTIAAGTLTQCTCKSEQQEIPVKNVIFLIGDGMGLDHAYATMLHQEQPLGLERAQVVGLQKTYSASHKVTDSAAAGTALATGTKTRNGIIGLDSDSVRLTSVLEKAAAKGLSTGLVATYRITHATPGAFIGHVPDRDMEEEIAADFLETDITFFVGGGRAKFEQRQDSRNLSDEFRAKDYQVVYTMEELAGIHSGKVAGLVHDSHLPRILKGRDPDYLLNASTKAFEILSQNEKGFFVMIDGSQIDGGGHANSIEEIVTETVDFDKVVRAAFDFADAHPGTLVVVTADHETGGLTLPADGREVKYLFSTGGHTGVMVPVYAYGAGAGRFGGILENTDIPRRMMELLGL